jgi:hypothetical protein
MPIKDKEKLKLYNKLYYENKKTKPPSELVNQSLLLIFNKRYKKVLKQILPIARIKCQVRQNYYEVMKEYKEKAVEYFEYRELKTKLKSYLKPNVELIQINKSPPLFWKVKQEENGNYYIEQYETAIGRNSLGKNVFTSFFDKSNNIKENLTIDKLHHFNLFDNTKNYTDNKCNIRVKGF